MGIIGGVLAVAAALGVVALLAIANAGYKQGVYRFQFKSRRR